MSKPTKTDILKKAMLEALEKSLGIVTTACKQVGIHRSTYYDWFNNDSDFKRQVEDIQNICLDFSESALLKLIEEGNVSATIFYLKTKGKKRGFVERQEIVQRVDIETELQELSDEQLHQRLSELRNAIKN